MLLSGQNRLLAFETIRANHYSKSVPSGKTLAYAFEDALVLFSIPANRNISQYLLGRKNAVWELSRLWAPDGHHRNLLTMALSASISQFKLACPECHALVSYADPNVGHEGHVYRAASWSYKGQSKEGRYYRNADGTTISRRAFHSGSKGMTKAEIEAKGYVQLTLPGKHRFAKGLTRFGRKVIGA